MSPIHPLDRLSEAILTNVVGFEVDGIRVLGAEFGSQPFIGPRGGPQYSVTLILTDPPDGGPGWPRGVARAIHRRAHDAMHAVDDTGLFPALRFSAEHPNYGYGRVSR
jgi:hypothetical protein